MSKYAAIPSFSEIIAQIGEALWVIGPTGFWVYVNPTFARFIGIRDDEVYSHPLFDYIHPDDKEECARVFESLKSGSDIAEIRYRLIHREGMDIWVSSVITAVKDAGRQVQYYVGTSRKVSAERTEFVRAETADRSSQAALPGAPDIPFESVIELMADPVWVIDTGRFFVFTNPAFNLIVGYSREELVGKNISEITDHNKREVLDSCIKQLIEGEEITEVDIHLKHRSGSQVPIRFLIKPVRSPEGGIKFFIGSNREQGQILPNSALPDPTAPYRAALERIGVPAWITDAKGNWIFVNGAFCSMLGLRAGESPSGNLPSIVHIDDQSLIKSAYADLKNTDTVNLSCRVQPGTGRLYWMSITLSAIRVDNEELTYIISAGHDLTNERSLETRLSLANCKVQELADLMDDAVLGIDKFGKVRIINNKVPDMLDRMDFEILEQDLVALFPQSYAGTIGNMLSKAQVGESGTELVTIDTSEGPLKLLLKCAPIKHEGTVDGALFVLKGAE
jgi:PAS domain S-box-containing protein